MDNLRHAFGFIQKAHSLSEKDQERNILQTLVKEIERILQGENPFQTEEKIIKISENTTTLQAQFQEITRKMDMLLEKVELQGNTANSTNSTNSTNSANLANSIHSSGKRTYAQVAQNIQNAQKTATTATKELEKRQPTKKEERENFQKRQLVLFTDKEHIISPLETRNKINTSFKEKLSILKPVLASITKSQRKQNIVLTTTKEFNSNFLLQHKDIWAHSF